MLISSMDQLSYYSVPKDDGFLEIDTRTGGYAIPTSSMTLQDDAQNYNDENSPKNGTKSSLYKTELCKRFSEFGSCRYGAKCQFAHGIGELRHVVRHPKYKTTKCKSYWGSGHCPYGSRCRFIHEETESLTQQPQFSLSPPPSSVFMHDKQAAYASMNMSMNMQSSSSSLGASNGYLYDVESVHGSLGAYSKEYAPLPPFEKSASAPWGLGGPSRSQARMGAYGDGYSVNANGNMNVNVNGKESMVPGSGSGLTTGVLTPPNNRSHSTDDGASFPDLQDAIDALVKFSISPSSSSTPQVVSSQPRPSSMDAINTTPMETLSASATSTATTSAHTSSSEFSLDSDDLWKHFPTLSDPSNEFGENEWPTGVSLSLEATGLFDAEEKEAAAALGTTPNAKKDETSPRLSVFERFH